VIKLKNISKYAITRTVPNLKMSCYLMWGNVVWGTWDFSKFEKFTTLFSYKKN